MGSASRGLALLLLCAGPVSAGDDLEWRLGDLVLAPTGYVQADLQHEQNWDVPEDEPLPGSQLPRRLRVGVEGEWGLLTFQAEGDPDDGSEHLKDLWADLRFARALRLRAGNFKLPVSAERLTSAAKLDFVARSRLADDLAAGRDWGAMLHGRVGSAVEYAAGVFVGDGRRADSRADTTGAARLVLTPVDDLDLGGSFSLGRVSDASTPDDPAPRGLRGSAVSGYPVFVRHHVDGERRRIGFDAGWRRGPVGFTAEVLETREERDGQGSDCAVVSGGLACSDLPALRSRGASVALTWLVTGEKKKSRIEPERRLFTGPGAVELGVRAEAVRFDDVSEGGSFAGVGPRARNVRRAGVDALTAGVSWWPWAWHRFMANVVVERFTDPLLAPESRRRGDYVTLLFRWQLEVP